MLYAFHWQLFVEENTEENTCILLVSKQAFTGVSQEKGMSRSGYELMYRKGRQLSICKAFKKVPPSSLD